MQPHRNKEQQQKKNKGFKQTQLVGLSLSLWALIINYMENHVINWK